MGSVQVEGTSEWVAGRAGLTFVPYHELAGRPNVIVDGSPTDGTVLCLTHWPGISCPAQLRADLSAQMAFAYLESFDLHGPAEAVSNNHFDQDGLVACYALTSPELALARRELLVDVARAGDFATFRDRRAARISMVVWAYADPDRSPVGTLPSSYPEQTGILYQELLGRLSEVCNYPERYRDLWAEEDAALSASEAALSGGGAVIDEVGDIDLAVVTEAAGTTGAGGHRFGAMWASGLHPMALYNATRCFRVLAMKGQCYEFTDRCETWVQYRSMVPRPRVDMQPLAQRLNDRESSGGPWSAGKPSALTPSLKLEGAQESSVAPELFRSLVEAYLRTAPPAWDPYQPPP